MELTMEALLPIVADLTDRYTSKDSSSVSYETARMLMAAVIYCVREWEQSGERLPFAGEEDRYWQMAYRLGYEKVLEKTYRAKAIYEAIIKDFQNYRCRNYQDTIIKGIPAFFVKYDPRFCPQDHLLMLDYPALSVDMKKTGVDLIRDYLAGIQIEQEFLSRFDRRGIMSLLERIQPEYESLYLDNICRAVLLQAIGCALAGTSVRALLLDAEGKKAIAHCFEADEKEGIAEKIKIIIQKLATGMEIPGATAYLAQAAEDYGARVAYGLENQCLDMVFV